MARTEPGLQFIEDVIQKAPPLSLACELVLVLLGGGILVRLPSSTSSLITDAFTDGKTWLLHEMVHMLPAVHGHGDRLFPWVRPGG